MGRFRSKLKGAKKGKRWPKGQSSSSNPETRKYRDLAKSGFFQENLGPSNLTFDAIRKHDALQTLPPIKQMEMDEESESAGTSTYQTGNSFASDWSNCTSMSFGRFMNLFRSDSALHKDMLAILAAVTEIIKERGGTESPTEYYCSLVTALEQVMSQEDKNEDQVTAILALLNMGIKTVPEAVLRNGFDSVVQQLLLVLSTYADSENNVIFKSLFGVLAILLKSQEPAIWTLSSTAQIFSAILNPFCIHMKPKWRRAAQNAVVVICSNDKNSVASDKTAEFCEKILEGCLTSSGTTKSGQTTILHALGLMKETISFFSKIHMKKCCEIILRLMTLNYPIVKSCSLQVLYALFSHQNAVVPSKLNAQLITALYDYQPNATDIQPMLAWITVMQQAHIHLADVDLPLASTALPKIFAVFAQLWLSQRTQVMSSVTHGLEALLRDAITPACETLLAFEQYKVKLGKCFNAIEQCLSYQYNAVWNQALHVIKIMFEVGGKHCASLFLTTLKSLAELRDSYKFSYNNELEHAVGAAVRSLGPEVVLGVITLKKDNGEFNMDRSWLLPVLKENIKTSTLQYFLDSILPLIMFCQRHSAELAKSNDGIGSHSYELIALQLWHLLPSFCISPVDIKENFKNVAKILGTAISDHKELRLAVMSSLRKLIQCASESENSEDIAELARFDKNYLPILFNFYTTKPNGTDEEGQRLAALDTIKVYLAIARSELAEQLFEHALERLGTPSSEPTETSDLYTKESILDLIRALVPYQKSAGIDKLYKQCIKMLPEIKSKKEQKKAYRLLEEICGSDAECCKQFIKNNRKIVQKLLMKTLNSAAISSKGARLRCMIYLVKAQPHLNHESVLLRSIVPEAVICCKDINERCREAAFTLINTIGEILLNCNEMQQFIELVIAGLAGTPQTMSATTVALASVLHNFSGALGQDNIQAILENVCNLSVLPTREIVGSCLSFVKVFCTRLPSPIVASSLGVIMKSLTKMTEDCKRHFRLKVRDILNRLVRKFGSDALTPFIPTSDTVMYKRLRNLRKLNARKKRNKEDKDEESHSEEEFIVNAKPKSIEDILADSDSDLEGLDVEIQKSKPQRNTWIHEDADSIIDFTDPRVSNKITVTKPNASSSESTKSKTKKNRGFKMSSDGRLIIEDDSESDTDQPKTKGFMKLEDSDSDDEKAETTSMKSQLSNKKRKRSDAESMKSSQTNRSSMKYQAGGSGIHRPISTSSVRSGFGSEYKSRKAGGDMKKKGKVDPYAYVPLKRSLLNKRKKAKLIGQFKGLGMAAKLGVKKGAKAKNTMKRRK